MLHNGTEIIFLNHEFYLKIIISDWTNEIHEKQRQRVASLSEFDLRVIN